MPFKSQAQAKWMFMNKPGMAKEYASKTMKSLKLLPKKVHRSSAKGAAKRLGY